MAEIFGMEYGSFRTNWKIYKFFGKTVVYV